MAAPDRSNHSAEGDELLRQAGVSPVNRSVRPTVGAYGGPPTVRCAAPNVLCWWRGRVTDRPEDVDVSRPRAVVSRLTAILDRAGAVVPTVRGRLSALVGLALIPALVIVGYDEWLARQRAFDSLTDLVTRVVRLMQRELDDRTTRAA